MLKAIASLTQTFISILKYNLWTESLSYFRKIYTAHRKVSSSISPDHIHSDVMKRLQHTAKGLYSLLPKDGRFSYSIIIAINSSHSPVLKTALDSILNQQIPHLEICLGFTQNPSIELLNLLSHYPQIHTLTYVKNQERISVINQLVEMANNSYIFIMEEEDWIRPDLFLRYEQTLRALQHPENTLLYCNLNRLSKRDGFIRTRVYTHEQPSELHFPYFFDPFIAKGMLIPTHAWKKVGGLQQKFKGAEFNHLLLKLNSSRIFFQHIPMTLYFMRQEREDYLKSISQTTFLEALEDYTKCENLDWKWEQGYLPYSARAIPKIKQEHQILAIICFKDQKQLTLQCVKSLMEQIGINLKICAVDNDSEDRTIAKELTLLGVEVLSINTPFNYSLLNNRAVKESVLGKNCDLLLFINNDVELDNDAVKEMVRWIDQPSIGMVGCRLHYPDGRLQHGGVSLDRNIGPAMHWQHDEKMKPFEKLTQTKIHRVTEAVTAACALMKREIFEKIDGFDEIWYPIGFSDTHLATKLHNVGLKNFYTPYAVGIHYESVSRKISLEEFENSWWLHQLIAQRR